MSGPAPGMEARFLGRLGEFSLDVDFTCPARGVTALFGPSGCGKTTILRCIAGLTRMKGRFRIDGEPWQDDDAAVFLKAHQRSVGYVFQEASLFPHLSVRRNLEYGFRRVAREHRLVEVGDAAKLLGLEKLLERRPGALSGGQKQRVAIARALLSSPRLLLMDEPLASLDRRSRDEILPYLERLHDELDMPVIYVSHAADEVTRLADHVVLIDEGRVRAQGPLAQVCARIDLADELGSEFGTVIGAVVREHDDEFALTVLDFSGGILFVPRSRLPRGSPARVRVLAKDVSITLHCPSGTSLLNSFSAEISEIAPHGEAEVLIRLDVSGQPLLARITRKSRVLLGLEVGAHVSVQFEAAAIGE